MEFSLQFLNTLLYSIGFGICLLFDSGCILYIYFYLFNFVLGGYYDLSGYIYIRLVLFELTLGDIECPVERT